MRAGRNRSGLAAVLAGLLAFAWAPGRAGAEEALETAVKATYLYKLAPFVEWPATAFEGPGAPLSICVVGEDPFGSVLDRAVAGQRVGARAILVHRLPLIHAREGCEIMYLGGSRAQSVAQALKIVRGEPVLTVTDGSGARGIVDFVLTQGRVRFRIDEQEASDSGLRISSKLLGLAVSVVPRRTGRP